MQPQGKQFSCTVGGNEITFETGKLAGQAGGAVTIRLGDSIIFCSATMSKKPREGFDFFPLTVDYEERMYAGGRIPGSFFRREGRPNGEAILTCRLTDRPLRPLFPKGMRNEVQVIAVSISADIENPLDILTINAASAALMISDIPWAGPIGAVRIGQVNGEFVANPTYAQLEESDLDLRVAGTREALLMVECHASEISEDRMVEALEFAHMSLQPLVDAQEKMASEIGKAKVEVPLFLQDEDLVQKVYGAAADRLTAALAAPHTKAELDDANNAIRDAVMEELAGEDEELANQVKKAFEEASKKVVRQRILNDSIRPDGRPLGEVRPIWCEVDSSPRAHGSAIFTRGETQAFTFATLGTPREAQEIDSLTPTEHKRYMHHYNFPPYSTGEAKFLRGQSRREIGHGALAERALMPVLPPEDEFPYTIRLVSEILSSNGSSSMASVCGSTLALMDTGVPITAPVAGVAMGLIKEDDRYSILTDIQGMEDHLGDMDFKVAGTKKGITALQMDIKISGLTADLMSEALSQANTARMTILDKMIAVISTPRPEMKPHVPRITIVKIPIDKIGAIIGPGGKTIRSLQEETGAKIDISDDGSVYIAASDGPSEALAREKIEALTEVPVIGRIYTGRVVRITDFGAFIEILPNMDGMVHISQMDSERIERVEDVVQVGEELTVMVTNIDENGRIRLSRKAVLEGWTTEEAIESENRGRSRSGGGGGGRSGGRGGRSNDRSRNDRNRR
jgi:polyribonucleotide nucleotidyltransferase